MIDNMIRIALLQPNFYLSTIFLQSSNGLFEFALFCWKYKKSCMHYIYVMVQTIGDYVAFSEGWKSLTTRPYVNIKPDLSRKGLPHEIHEKVLYFFPHKNSESPELGRLLHYKEPNKVST